MTRITELKAEALDRPDYARRKCVAELCALYEAELARKDAALRGIHTILSESGMPLSATRCGDILALLHSAWPDDVDGLTGCADDQTFAAFTADEIREAARALTPATETGETK